MNLVGSHMAVHCLSASEYFAYVTVRFTHQSRVGFLYRNVRRSQIL